jgi:hypothetical protein
MTIQAEDFVSVEDDGTGGYDLMVWTADGEAMRVTGGRNRVEVENMASIIADAVRTW